MSDDRYYVIRLDTNPLESRSNWMVCDNTRLGGGQVCVCDKELDALHIKALLNRDPNRKDVLAHE